MRRVLKYYLFVYQDRTHIKIVRSCLNFFRESLPALLHLRKNRRIIDLQRNVHEVLPICMKALREANVFFWLDFGTLLGAYREHDIIVHDYDVDLAVWDDTDPSLLDQILLCAGFNKYRTFFVNGRMFCNSYICKGVVVDVMFYHRIKENSQEAYCYDVYSLPNVFIDEYQNFNILGLYKITFLIRDYKEILFLGESVFIPDNTEEYLSSYYGENFMTPDPNFYGHHEPANRVTLNPDEGVAIYTKYD